MKKQKQRKPLDEKGDSYESSCHQRPACLRASSQQSNADTMNPTGPPFSSRKNLGPRGPKNLVTTRARRECFLGFSFIDIKACNAVGGVDE